MKRLWTVILGLITLLVLLALAVLLRDWLPSRALVRPSIGTSYKVVASAYSPSPYQTDATPCITAVGTRVRKGVIASNFLPIGTIVSIGDDLFIVEDRMNSRYQSGYIDIWFPSTKEAIEFGRQRLQITIVDYGTPGQSLVRADDKNTVVQPGSFERMNLRFMAYSNVFTNSLKAAVSGKGDVNCAETQ